MSADEARLDPVNETLAPIGLSRRKFLRTTALLALALPAGSALLAACGDEEDDAPEATTAPSTDPTATTAPVEATEEEEEEPGEATEAPAEATEAEEEEEADPTATTPAADGDARYGGTLRFARQGSPNGVEPQIDWTIGTTIWQLNVYDTLITNDRDGYLIGCLAESWEALDPVSYVFNIRQGVTFHDGAPFDAHDVVFSIARILDEETGATRRPEFARIDSYEATDDFTVAITMKEPYATFLEVLANRGSTMVSKDFDGDYSQGMNGTGPFMCEPWEPDVVYPLIKNPNYWQEGLPYLDRVEIVPIPDDNARVSALQSGNVNMADYIPYQFVDDFRADSNFEIFTGYEIYNYIRINVNREPMTDKRVRQALNYAVDRQMVIDLAFGGYSEPMTVGLIPPGDPVWYNHDLDGHWNYDPAKALELLAEAGYSNPADLSFTLESSSEPNHLDSAQIIVEQWRALGISAELQPLESAVRVEKRFSGDYTIMFDGAQNPWTDPDFYSLYISSTGPVYAVGIGYNNPEIDRLLAEGRATVGQDDRKAIYRQLEEELLEDAPFVFLNFRPQSEACAANVKGYVRVPGVGPASMQFLEHIWLEE